MRDPRKGGTEFYFDLHEYIDPAIKLISYMNLYRIENNQSLNDEVDLDIAEEFAKKNGGRLHTIDDSCWEAYGDLPIAPERVDIQGVESKTYNHYDLYDIVQNDEINAALREFIPARNLNQLETVSSWILESIENKGLDPVNITEDQLRDVFLEQFDYEYIEPWKIDELLDDLIESHAFTADFIFDLKDYLKMKQPMLRNPIQGNISKIMTVALELYLGEHYHDSNTEAGEIQTVEVLSINKGRSDHSELREF